jgi:hypothetical protein
MTAAWSEDSVTAPLACGRTPAAVQTAIEASAGPRFYLGSHEPAWLARTTVPLFVSHRRLSSRKRLPRAAGSWALDSGGFTELALHGRWVTSATAYTAAVRRYRDEVGGLAWAAPQDWMCEPAMLAGTGLTVREHQERTVRSVIDLRDMAPDLPFVPVLQGWSATDYLRCVELYQRHGLDLWRAAVVGLGSVCRRQATAEIEDIVLSLAVLGLRLHGFGVKIAGLARYAEHLASADSLAWSYEARRTDPLPDCTHRNCANCMTYALAWHARVTERLRAVQLRLPVEEAATAAGVPPGGWSGSGAMLDAAGRPADPAPAVVAPDALRCEHCGSAFVAPARRRGSPPRFCCPAHREAARLRRERGVPESHPPEANRHGRRPLRLGGRDESAVLPAGRTAASVREGGDGA